MPTNAPHQPKKPASPIAGKPEWTRLANALKARREELDLTQIEVTSRAGISHSASTPIETQRSPYVPSTRTLRKVAAALEWTPQSCELILKGKKPIVAASNAPVPAAAPVVTLDAFSQDLDALKTKDPDTYEQLVGEDAALEDRVHPVEEPDEHGLGVDADEDAEVGEPVDALNEEGC